MVSKTMLYKQFKNWVASAKVKPTFSNIFFSHDTAFASDTHKLVMVKNWKVDTPYMEDVKGNKPQGMDDEEMIKTADEMYGKCLKVIPSDERCQWSATINRKWFPHIKNACEFVKKATKKAQFPGMSVLNHTGGNLYLIAGDLNDKLNDKDEMFGAKFLLADDMTYRDNSSAGATWYGYWNAGYLMNALEFAIESGVVELKLSIQFNHHTLSASNTDGNPDIERNNWSGLWKIETEDLVMVSTSMRPGDRYGGKLGHLDMMTELEAKRPPSNAWIELPQD